MAHAVALRQAMRQSCVALPGSFNALTGRMAADIGFEGVYVSGAAVTATLGQPDVGSELSLALLLIRCPAQPGLVARVHQDHPRDLPLLRAAYHRRC